MTQPEELFKVLLEKGITIAEAGRQLGIRRQQMSRYTQKSTMILPPTAQKLRDFFGEKAVKLIET